MSGVLCVIGCDPGPPGGGTTGLAIAYWDGAWGHPGAYQCDAASAPALLDWLVALNTEPAVIGDGLAVRAGIEEFRPGTGAGARGRNASATRAQVEELKAVLAARGIAPLVRPAAEVKTWATDKRLERAGLIEVTAGMPKHSRDAMRTLLFAACHKGEVPDPLSRKGKQ